MCSFAFMRLFQWNAVSDGADRKDETSPKEAAEFSKL
jgi:hypothetical protein